MRNGEIFEEVDVYDLPGEIWKEIPEKPGFEVSSHGRVKRTFSGARRRLVAHTRNRRKNRTEHSYVYLRTSRNDKDVKYIKVADLVARLFLDLDGGMVAHKDGNTANCRADNLISSIDKGPLYGPILTQTFTTSLGVRVCRFVSGDSGALDAFIAEFSAKCTRLLSRRYQQDQALVQGAVFDGFSVALRRIKAGALRTENKIEGFFFTYAKNKVLDQMRIESRYTSEWREHDDGDELSVFDALAYQQYEEDYDFCDAESI